MTHYRSQLSLLKHGLRNLRDGGRDVELHTADRFQGRDKEVVVLSLVRSNEARSIGDLLRDWRRVNVAFTRAKTKLLVVGSRDTLRGCGDGEMLSRFVRMMEDRDWVYDLPADALESHLPPGPVPVGADGVPSCSPSSPPRKRSPRKTSPMKKNPMKGTVRGGGSQGVGGKENERPGPKRGNITNKALLRNHPVSRDILNEMLDGIY
ncbi:AAA domain-containing protein [Xylariaceae sp. FL0804]|nr:AAA domain-containing protein [Xylariaceae sp. FL0804]